MQREVSYYEDGSLSAAAYDHVEGALIAAGLSPCCGDVAFYGALADRRPGPVLDAGTGTGRIAWGLADAGRPVVGLDLAPAMLSLAERKRAEHPAAAVRFVQGDMTDFDLGERFGFAAVAHRGLNHVLQPDRQRAALACLHRHLVPDGLLALHMMEPAGDVALQGGERPLSRPLAVRDPAGVAVEWTVLERRADPMLQHVSHLVGYRIARADGAVLAQSRETLTYRWATQQELRYLFELCGFAVEALYGDFRGGDPGPGKEQVWVLRRL